MQADILERLNNIAQYLATHPNQSEIISQLIKHRETLKSLQDAIDRKDFKAAFIGKIGVGKTSAISKLLNLQYKETEEADTIEILKTGSGRTTVCEVIFEYAERYSIAIQPLPEVEVKRTVSDFAEFIWNKTNKDISEDDEGGSLLSEEMNRCIRNMLGIPIKRERLQEGKQKSVDMAIELAKGCKSIDELKELMFECLSIEQRTASEIWPSPDENREWHKWLKKHFADINDGKNKQMSLPDKLIVRGPLTLTINGISWSIVDTRGIDGNVSRADLRKIIYEDGTFPILTSSFNDAPDTDVRSVIEMGCNLGYLEKLKREAVLLILDKDESHKVTDVDPNLTTKKDKILDGRAIREEQVYNKLTHDVKSNGYIAFFDSKQEDSEILWDILSSRHKAYIDHHNKEVLSVISAIDELLRAEAQQYIAFSNALQNLYEQWRQTADEDTPNWEHFGNKLLKHLEKIHHRTLAASIRRNGIYSNLDFYEIVRGIAIKAGNDFVVGETTQLQKSLTKIIEDNEFYDFQDQANSELRKIEREMQSFVEQLEDLASNTWNMYLGSQQPTWSDWDAEWGQGSGYKKRVLEKIYH
jgi:GTPase SAR1 family protein